MLGRISAGLAALTAAVHVFLGGADALRPMLAAQLPLESEGAMHAVWYMVSAFLIWSVVVFWRGGAAMFHFALLWIVSAAVFIYVGLFQDGLNGLLTNPQWTVLGLTGVIAMLGAKRSAE